MDLTCNEEMLPASNSNCNSLFDSAKTLGGASNNTKYLAEQLIPEEFFIAKPDLAILSDPRVLANMLQSEETNLATCNYFEVLQHDLTPDMRRSVTTWMFEVCEEEAFPGNVFLRAVNYMDRFLMHEKINQTQFQLVGAVCLLISSKWSGHTFNISKLSFYTASSCTTSMIVEWELLILARLKWDTFFITPVDFVDHILPKLEEAKIGHLPDLPDIKNTIAIYINYCATDDKFCAHPPSMIASASIVAAIGNHVNNSVLQQIANALHQITNIETDVLMSCMEQLRAKIIQVMMSESCKIGLDPGTTPTRMSGEKKNSATTPKDVYDINF